MDDKKTLRVIVNGSDDVENRAGLPRHGLGYAMTRAIDVSIANLQDEVNETLQGIFSLLSKLTMSKGNFTVDEINFSVGIDASGKVNLLSVASGTVGTKSCIQFKIKRTNHNDS